MFYQIRYLYFVLFFLASFLFFSFPAWASNTHAISNQINQAQQLPSWLTAGGGTTVGCGVGVAIKSQVDKFLERSSVTVAGKREDYTNSPQYLKEKMKVICTQSIKIKASLERLNRRFQYIERYLIRQHSDYQSYDDYKNHKSTVA